MSGSIANPSESTLDRYTPPALLWARDAARRQVAADLVASQPLTDADGRTVRTDLAPETTADQPPGPTAARGGVPSVDPQMYVLTSLPAPGSVLPVDQSSGLGRALSGMLGAEQQPRTPTRTSNWSDGNDMRVVLPVMRRQDSPFSSAIETLPGRNQHWATVRIADHGADPRLNWDGRQAAVRLGVGGPMINPNFGPFQDRQQQSNALAVQWAEFRVGAEGLVFTGQVADGSFRISGFDLEQGFFKSQVDGLGRWAGQNLALAIPLGIVGAGAAALAINRVADWTNSDIPLPISIDVFNQGGFRVRPTVRPIFGTTEFIRFGGADLGLGYRIPGKVDVMVRPGWNLDPTNGAVGPRVGARVTVPFQLPGNIPGSAGLEMAYNPQSGVSAYLGAGFTF